MKNQSLNNFVKKKSEEEDIFLVGPELVYLRGEIKIQ